MGAEGVTVDKLDDVGEALDKACDAQKRGKTTVIEVMVTQELGDPFRRDALKYPKRCSTNTSIPTWRRRCERRRPHPRPQRGFIVAQIRPVRFELGLRFKGQITAIGGEPEFTAEGPGGDRTNARPDREALDFILAWLSEKGVAHGSLAACGHRIVHGGSKYLSPTIVTDDVAPTSTS